MVQVVWFAPPEQAYPASQVLQEVFATVVLYEPAGQVVHDVLLELLLNVPAGQKEHTLCPSFEA